MKIGTTVVKEVTLYEITIEGRGGNSVHEEYYETEDAAILASAVDGQDRTPTEVTAYQLSDGSYIFLQRKSASASRQRKSKLPS